MNLRNLLVLVLLVCLSNPALAVVVGTKDWKQVTDTAGYTWNDFDAIYDTSTGQCDVAGCLLGGVIDLTGYTWASTADVDQLFQDYGLTGLSSLTSPNSVAHGVNALDPFFDDFNATFIDAITMQIHGWTRNQGVSPSQADSIRAVKFIGNLDLVGTDQTELFAINVSAGFTHRGAWHYKDLTGVPEPTTLALMSLGLLGLGFRRKRKN